jgi:hypothetical protein
MQLQAFVYIPAKQKSMLFGLAFMEGDFQGRNFKVSFHTSACCVCCCEIAYIPLLQKSLHVGVICAGLQTLSISTSRLTRGVTDTYA